MISGSWPRSAQGDGTSDNRRPVPPGRTAGERQAERGLMRRVAVQDAEDELVTRKGTTRCPQRSPPHEDFDRPTSPAIHADDRGQPRPVSVAHRRLQSVRKLRPCDRPLRALVGAEAHADDPPRLDPGEPGRTHERKGRQGVGVRDGEERSSASLRPEPPRKPSVRRRVKNLVDVEGLRAVADPAGRVLDQEHVVPIDRGSFGIRNARAGDEEHDRHQRQRRRPSHGRSMSRRPDSVCGPE